MIEQLENLVRTGGLKTEPPDANESAGLLRSAIDRLTQYEGYWDVDESLLKELLQAGDELLRKIQK